MILTLSYLQRSQVRLLRGTDSLLIRVNIGQLRLNVERLIIALNELRVYNIVVV